MGRKTPTILPSFEERMMNLDVNIEIEEALNLGWATLAECFEANEVGIKQNLVENYWPLQVAER